MLFGVVSGFLAICNMERVGIGIYVLEKYI